MHANFENIKGIGHSCPSHQAFTMVRLMEASKILDATSNLTVRSEEGAEPPPQKLCD